MQCSRCGRSIAPEIDSDTFKRLAAKEKMPLLEQDAWCQDCRRMEFALRLVGENRSPILTPPVILRERKLTGAEIIEKQRRPGEQVFKSCCFFCNSGCDAMVYVKNGRVERVEGDPESPTTRGKLCAKGLASTQVLYHGNRLTTPLRRAGERGAGRWEPISWDTAFDIIVKNLTRIRQHHGPQGVALAVGTSRGWSEVFNRFANVYKSQWVAPGVAQCLWPRLLAGNIVLGGVALECPDYEQTKCLLVWGVNPPATWPIKAMGMMEAKSRGAPLIVVDPVLSNTAAKADIWLQLRPGTDCALALGMLHVIINHGIYDEEFVNHWCTGFEELAKGVKEFTPAKVEAITWVPRDLIVEAAKLYATVHPACITQCVTLDQNADTISTCRSLAILAAITGNIDIPGGNLFPMPKGVVDRVSPSWTKIDLWSEEEKGQILGYGQFPLLSGSPDFNPSQPSAVPTLVWDAILTGKPYPIKGLYLHGSNPLLSYANSRKVRQALLALEFFAAVDLFHTPSTELADIVLPSATWLERDFVISGFQISADGIHLQQKVAQIGESRSDVTILNQLAQRLGLGHLFESEQALADYVLSPLGMTFDEFRQTKRHYIPMRYRKYEAKGFRTASGKVELASPIVAKLGGNPVPHYVEPFESCGSTPVLAEEFPLVLTTGGVSPVYRHTELRHIPWLREISPHLMANMNDQTGLRLGLKNGDQVTVESPHGRIRVLLRLHPGIDPRVVQVSHGWPEEENVNLLTDNEKLAELVGSTCLRGLLCRVYKETP